MKTLTDIRVLISLFAINAGVLWGAPTAANLAGNGGQAATQDAPYAVVDQGANHRVWQRTTYETLPSGQKVPRVQQYTELATGLNYQKNGKWVESKEEIELLPGGAIARQGQHQVIFANNLATVGAIDMQTPDGKRLRSHVLGLSYFDTASGQSVLIAEVKDSQGELYPPNVVVYPDAFTDFKADVRYTYTRAGFEQDIILHERPPGPEAYGLNPATTKLQVLTEFINPPQPVKKQMTLKTRQGDALDEALDFGAIQMGCGKAFSLDRSGGDIPVSKQWLKLEGRDFLVEEVGMPDIDEELQALPAAEGAALNPAAGSVRHVVSKQRRLPVLPLVQAGTNAMQLARLSLPTQGLVLDYVTMTSQTGYTFLGDTTYYISGAVNLYGTNTFEGGAVLKYANNASLAVTPSQYPLMINCLASAYRPVVFTAKDDNSVGETISGSTGNPSGYYANPALQIVGRGNTVPTISNFRIAYARQAISLIGNEPNFYHGQIVNCQNGITVNGANLIHLRNVLFGNVQTNFNNLYQGNFDVQNSTFSGSAYLSTIQNTPNQYSSVTLVNCLLANVTNLQNTYSYSNNGIYQVCGSYNGVYKSPVFGTCTITNTFYPFQSVGAGNYYLAAGCAFINAGTTNIDSALLAALQQKTTYPPIVYAPAIISTNLTFSSQAHRDTNGSPDLGYHYDPIDYALSGVYVINATVTINPGAVIATYATNNVTYGLGIGSGAQLFCQGWANSLIRIVQYNTVQEQAITNWNRVSSGSIKSEFLNVSPAATITCRFTDWSMPAQDAPHLNGTNGMCNPINLRDCQFHGGKLVSSYPTINLTNCLFERVYVSLRSADANIPSLRNNLFWRGTFDFASNVANALVKDNLFDQTSIPNNSGIYVTYNGGYNAFVTGYNRFQPTFASDVVLSSSPVYQSSWLGNYYLPPNSPLINAGSTTADQVGLFHYTTTTNEVKETNSIVDIGYHYVAVDSYGNPIDSNQDGIPDYWEDANGNGLVDNGETPWMPPPTITVQPACQTVCAGSAAGFCVTATGSSLNYQWQFNRTNLSGATGSCYTLTNVQPNQAGNYSVVVSNSCGWVTSSNATLTLNVAPVVTGQPANQAVCAGAAAGFCVTATGSSLNYQWQFNGTNISGATGSCYTLTNVQPNQAGNYSVVVSNSCGWVTSSNATLTLNVAPAITGQPANQMVCAGSAAGFCVTATGSSLNYQWQFNGTNISGATTNRCYMLTNVQPSQAGNYSVVVSNSCGSMTSSNALLTVNLAPVITGQPANQTVIQGGNATFGVTATGMLLNYQWYFNSGVLTNAIGATLTLTNVQPNQAGNYSVVVSNSCGWGSSSNAILVVVTDLSGSLTNYTFLSDTTYSIQTNIHLYGVTTIEGGAIIKFAGQPAAQLTLNGPLVCLTGPADLAILTSQDDNSVGETIPGSTGNPSNSNSGTYLSAGSGQTNDYTFLQLSYANVGIFGSGMVNVQNSQFVQCGTAVGCGAGGTVALMNNLFYYSAIANFATNLPSTLALSNNLVFGTTVNLSQPSNIVWQAFNNDFDTCTITNSTLTNGYNAYLNCNGRLYPTNAFDIVSANSLTYQSGALGNFYQPTNSPLIHKGSTTADQVGLYHYTVTTNQVVEGTNTVSIGFHYVATDAYGDPLDTNGDGIPDYLEDANGNGIYDAGDLGNWLINVYGLSPGNGLIVFTPLR